MICMIMDDDPPNNDRALLDRLNALKKSNIDLDAKKCFIQVR